jgi:two-component system invasion response regulator UvrY
MLGHLPEADKTLNILIADDHVNVRRGLRELIADAFSSARFSEVSNGDEVLEQLPSIQPDILLLDINMPGRSGMEILKEVKDAYPLMPVIMVSVQAENQYALRCLRAGAAEYVNKNSASEELVPAIRKIMDAGANAARSLNGR